MVGHLRKDSHSSSGLVPGGTVFIVSRTARALTPWSGTLQDGRRFGVSAKQRSLTPLFALSPHHRRATITRNREGVCSDNGSFHSLDDDARTVH